MDFMDLLLAEALAAGMARQAAEARQRPPPDNFFILPPDSQAWRKLYSACKEENMVVCIEITDDSHPGSRRAQPLFVELAREVSQIPFFRVKIGFGRTYDELRQDLGGIRFSPTILVVFFDDGGNRITKVEGEDEIRLGLRTGAVERVIKEYIDQRIKLKLSDRLAEQLFRGAMASEIERQKRRAHLEYEERLKKEKEEMERKELERQREENRKLEEEKKLRLEAEKNEEKTKRWLELEKRRARVEDELLMMDLSSTKIRDIKEKMTEAGISHVGATSREDLIQKLKNALPRLKNKLENASSQQQTGISMSGYTTQTRYSGTAETDGLFERGFESNGENVARLKRRVEQLERNVDELEQRREHLTSERDSLQRTLQDKEEEVRQKDKQLSERSSRRGGSFEGRRDSQSKVKELEEELMETRLLYSCTLDDLDIMGIIAKKEDGAVVRVKCSKSGLPNPSRVFAMKVLSGVMEANTMSTVRSKFKTEYEILSGLPQHNNIVKLFAFFYDRPKTQPKLKEKCGEGMALCVLMEQLSQNMEEHMNSLQRAGGPMASKTIGWIRDVVAGSHFLYSHNVVHRDMKLENLLISGKSVKIADFGTAIRIDATMKLPFTYAFIPRGGNEAHLAPEILNTRQALGKYLNYTKQPVWDAGVLAYELAGHRSPFERTSIDQRAYDVTSLPKLTTTYSQIASRQQPLPAGLTTLIKSMLEYDPDDRPTMDEVHKKMFMF